MLREERVRHPLRGQDVQRPSRGGTSGGLCRPHEKLHGAQSETWMFMRALKVFCRNRKSQLSFGLVIALL